MSCFPCFQSQKSKKANRSHHNNAERSVQFNEPKETESKKPKSPQANESKKEETPQVETSENSNINAQTFTFRELAAATKNFRQECLLGEGGFGRVYKGTLQSTNQVVAVKQLDRNGLQGNKEFLVEVLMLSLLHHQNLVNLIGYCADGDQRLLVYEYMPGGSVEDHLLDLREGQKPLDWVTRIKIALGAAQGLEYLHDKANPPVIYRDLKSSNILLDENFCPKLSDFGLAKLGPLGDKIHVSSRVMGTYGYCAPEYARTGHLTVKSDVYSYGVVLLELITGRRVIDTTRPVDEQNLISWAQPIFRDPKRFPDMADPLLKQQFSEKGLNQAVAIAAMCLQDEAGARPLMSDVVTALTFLSKDTDDIPPPAPENEDDEDDSYDEDESFYDDEEECEEFEDETKAGSSSQKDKDSSVVDEDKEGSKDEIQKGSSRRLASKTTSKKLKSASTQKSRAKADGSDPLSENKRCKSLNVQNQKSVKKAKDGSASSRSRSSRKSKSRSESSRHKSLKKKADGSSQTISTLRASAEESAFTRESPDD